MAIANHGPGDVQVIYPGSNCHVGVARVFGREYVVHVDPDHESMRVLKAGGYSAVELPIEEYSPAAPVDVIVALNSYGEPSETVIQRLLKPGGYVIANNWTGWAHDLSDITGLELVGALMPAYSVPDCRWVEGADLPKESTGAYVEYYTISDGVFSKGTAEQHTFADEAFRNVDALFVFRKTSQTS